ncbi:MAG: hypothetical protein KAJ19_18210 [Gammaproteobacteria bacterium]|nr:hypothetical protein [Gammaproteobacteria bacterium]
MTEALRLIELIDTLILGGAAGEDITLSHKEALAIRTELMTLATEHKRMAITMVDIANGKYDASGDTPEYLCANNVPESYWPQVPSETMEHPPTPKE